MRDARNRHRVLVGNYEASRSFGKVGIGITKTDPKETGVEGGGCCVVWCWQVVDTCEYGDEPPTCLEGG
jgi:hypothetical protein